MATPLIVVLVGVSTIVVSTVALAGVDAVGAPDIVMQLVPFLVLSAFVRKLSRVGAGVLTTLLVVGTVANQAVVYTSEGSTASIGLFFNPLLFALGVGLGVMIDLAVRNA